MKKIVFAAFLFLSFSFSAVYDLNTLKQKNNSLAKDYYIHRLFELNRISKQEAQGLRKHIFRYACKLKKVFEKFVPYKAYVNPKYRACFNYTKNNILDANSTCQIYRLNSLIFMSNLDFNTKDKLANKFKQNNPDLSALLKAFNTNDPLRYIVNNNAYSNFIKVSNFFNKPDIALSKDFADSLVKQNGFFSYIQGIIIQKTHRDLRISLLNVNPNLVSDDLAFHLALNALTFNEEQKAFAFFEKAYQTFRLQSHKDNALFWLYKISSKDEHLSKLAQSPSLNIYSIYAKELKNIPLKEFEFLSLKDKDTKVNFNMQDPFAWQDLSVKIQNSNEKELSEMANKFKSNHTLPIYSYIMERVHNFRKNYFIMPYFEHLQDYSKERQALILAIARQESRFIPTAVSTSYALGIMQFMPFVANHIAKKELKITNFDQDDMFKPEVAYHFANHHLDYLERNLGSIVFISYAYNGGIGFTNKMLNRDDMFKQGKFEPFLSMEFVPYRESRIYAKRVLANYVVYRLLLNDSIKISSIFESLIQNK